MSAMAVSAGNAAPKGGTQATTAKKGADSAVAELPFPKAARDHEEPFFDQSRTLSALIQQLGPVDLPSYGYVSNIGILVEATGGTGTSVTTAADGPWTVLQNLSFVDVNGAPIIHPISGYDLYLINKYGGYAFSGDQLLSPAFTAVGASTGNFTLYLRIPLEVNYRDAIGALPNGNSAQAYKINLSLGTLTQTYGGTVPSTPPSARVRMFFEGRDQPPAVNAAGRRQQTAPVGEGTTQFWSKTTRTVSSGFQTVPLSRVGNQIRTLIFVVRQSASRATADPNFPDPLELRLDARLLKNRGRLYWKQKMFESYAYGSAGLLGTIDAGVYVFTFCDEFDFKPGGELGDKYLPTAAGSRLEVQGSFGAGMDIDIMTNDIVPVGMVL